MGTPNDGARSRWAKLNDWSRPRWPKLRGWARLRREKWRDWSRPWRTKGAIALLLGGVGLIVLAFALFPRAVVPSPPAIFNLVVVSGNRFVNSHMRTIEYTVDQARPDRAIVTVQVILDGPVPVHLPPGADMSIALTRLNTPVTRCWPSCTPNRPLEPSPYSQGGAAFPHIGPNGDVIIFFTVRAASFGVETNGATVDVSFPSLQFSGTKPAMLYLTSPVPSFSRYDWSAFPPGNFTSTGALWAEPVVPQPGQGSFTPARVVSGVDHATEANDNTTTLLVGIMFGVGGSAAIAGVQEMLPDRPGRPRSS